MRRSGEAPDAGVALLAITRDIGLCANLWEIVSVWNWTVKQRPEAFPASDSDPIKVSAYPIIICDSEGSEAGWKECMRQLRMTGNDPCILLASRVYDPYLWDEVIRCGGFDVLLKSASREELARTLRFAWLWKERSQPPAAVHGR